MVFDVFLVVLWSIAVFNGFIGFYSGFVVFFQGFFVAFLLMFLCLTSGSYRFFVFAIFKNDS